MVTRRVSEAAAEWWLISSAAVAQGYRFIERWDLTQSARMDDGPCTAMPPSRFGLPFIHASLTVRVTNGWISRVAPTPSMTLVPTTHPEEPTNEKTRVSDQAYSGFVSIKLLRSIY